jgi:hypothetical protein
MYLPSNDGTTHRAFTAETMAISKTGFRQIIAMAMNSSQVQWQSHEEIFTMPNRII